MKTVIILLALFYAVAAVGFASRFKLRRVRNSSNEPEYFLNQRVSHFDPTVSTSFSQRYFIHDKFYKIHKDVSINFLYICGEAECPGTPNNYAQQYAQHLGARIFTLEHRYYGKSVPVKDLSSPNMRYLTTTEALADLAYFIQFINQKSHPNIAQKWVIIGCSYAGALSAWFRLKYPHLVVGAISSSGVINAVLDFYQFDEHVSKAVGPACLSRLQSVMRAIDQEYTKNPQQVKQYFKAEVIADDGDFFFFVADMAAEAVQYGFRQTLCDAIQADNVMNGKQLANEDLIQLYANFSINFFYKVFDPEAPLHATQQFLKDIRVTPDNSARQWTWQYCTELGYLQTAPQANSLRNKAVDMAYFKRFCTNVFSEAGFTYRFPPSTNFTNLNYGGEDIKATRVVFTQGSQDPWLEASKTVDDPAHDQNLLVIDCDNCGHCVDLRGCPSLPTATAENGEECTNWDNVNKARDFTMNKLLEWLH